MGALTFYYIKTTNTNSVILDPATKSVSFTHELKRTLLRVVLFFESAGELYKSYYDFLKEGRGVLIEPKGVAVQLETASPDTVIEGDVFENKAPREMAFRGDIIPLYVGTARITVERK